MPLMFSKLERSQRLYECSSILVMTCYFLWRRIYHPKKNYIPAAGLRASNQSRVHVTIRSGSQSMPVDNTYQRKCNCTSSTYPIFRGSREPAVFFATWFKAAGLEQYDAFNNRNQKQEHWVDTQPNEPFEALLGTHCCDSYCNLVVEAAAGPARGSHPCGSKAERHVHR